VFGGLFQEIEHKLRKKRQKANTKQTKGREDQKGRDCARGGILEERTNWTAKWDAQGEKSVKWKE